MKSVLTGDDSAVPYMEVPLSIPNICGNEWEYVRECLDTNWVSYVGSYVDKFEDIVGDYVGAKYAAATMSGTAALHTALLVAEVEPDDEVLVSALSFIAPANAIRYVGAYPVFIDSEDDYWQMDPKKVVDFLETKCRWSRGALYNKSSGRRIKAILPVHILGHPVDMSPILDIAKKYELVVIEDAAESLGAKYKGEHVGHLGDIGCFSFNGNKVITCGGGGMIVTDNEVWAHKAKHLTTQAKVDSLEYIHDDIGYNYRMTNIQAAIGVAQMEELDNFIKRKRQIAVAYTEGLSNLSDFVLMSESDSAFSTYWLYTIVLKQSKSKPNSRDLISLLQDRGIQSRPLWYPLHLQETYQDCEYYGIDCAHRLHALAVQLPSSSGITDQEIEHVVSSLQMLCGE